MTPEEAAKARQAAEEAARKARQVAIDASYITPTAADLESPIRMAELAVQAAAAGKILLLKPGESHTQRLLREREARQSAPKFPTVRGGDDAGFIKNLARIARGDVRVVNE